MTARRSLSKRVFWTISAVGLVVVCVFAVAGTLYLRSRLAEETRTELHDEASVVAAALNDAADDIELMSRLQMAGTRLTLVGPSGTPTYDNQEDAASMGNHLNRPEVAAAFKTGRGSASRASSTLGEAMVYEAVLLEDGSVVRLARKQDGVLTIFSTLIIPVAALAGVGVVAALITARRESRAIIAPLAAVDLDHPIRNLDTSYVEMEPMLNRIESQRKELKRQMRVLANNDRVRREFTANVTHELKTPLTTISGYAELIATGMVAAEDDRRDFARRIYKEAGRLTNLVNDILTLSNLDEAEHAGEEGARTAADVLGAPEEVDLPLLLDTVAQRLERVAEKAEVTLSLECEPAQVTGVPRLLDELAYNLASNAVRYNRPGGSVRLACGACAQTGKPYIQVSDTGIGIAPEEQDKVFERFYRVDKSRSKARGGTGLGLAIVKHAALYHGASIDLQSTPGSGTCITVRFAK